ncbi:hypothetical protein [Streptomyces sp. BA2]|uniref:hypothetical protein n=1 Tax=Streptomyces sp. BA2 TaxID=436595 RepID=UPI0019222332
MIVTALLVHGACLRVLELGKLGHHLGQHSLAHLGLLSLTHENQPSRRGAGGGHRATGLRAEIGQGLRHVLGNPELRALAFTAAVLNFGAVIVNTLLPVLFVRELHLPEGVLGLYWAVGGLGILLVAKSA